MRKKGLKGRIDNARTIVAVAKRTLTQFSLLYVNSIKCTSNFFSSPPPPPPPLVICIGAIKQRPRDMPRDISLTSPDLLNFQSNTRVVIISFEAMQYTSAFTKRVHLYRQTKRYVKEESMGSHNITYSR